MRVTFTFLAHVEDWNSGEEVPAPESINKRVLAREGLEDYFEPDLADLGVIGGEVRAIARNGQVVLAVDYWFPEGAANNETIARLKEETIAQLKDGIGESGFECVAEDKQLVVTAITEVDPAVDTVEDGRHVDKPSRIAIAARDGDLAALALAIESDLKGIERRHQGDTALQLAILYGHTEAVRILLAAGADATQLDGQGSTTLELCALTNSLDDEQSRKVAQMLLDAGANSNHISADGESAESYAQLRKKSRMAQIL